MILRWIILGPSQEPILSHRTEEQTLFFDSIYLASCSIPICSSLFQSLSHQLECKVKNTIWALSPSFPCPGCLEAERWFPVSPGTLISPWLTALAWGWEFRQVFYYIANGSSHSTRKPYDYWTLPSAVLLEVAACGAAAVLISQFCGSLTASATSVLPFIWDETCLLPWRLHWQRTPQVAKK